jgi:hypothetical protein
MAKTKATPSLPSSSRMQMPMTTDMTASIIRETGGMKGKAISAVKSGSVASKLVGSAKGLKGMKGSNPYC